MAGLNAMLTAQATTINPLVASVNENETAISFCKAVNTEQTSTIASLGTRIQNMSLILKGDS